MHALERLEEAISGAPPAAIDQAGPAPAAAALHRSVFASWLIHDSPYITMLLLALVGVVFRLPVLYWVVLIPVFGVISVVAGWRYFATRETRLDLMCRVALNWCALLAAIYLLYNSGVQGVLNANASSLAMMTLLALGTFVAGVQARVWRICAVGAILFLAVPGLGWLDQSPMMMVVGAILIIALGGFAWWVSVWSSDAGVTTSPAQPEVRAGSRSPGSRAP